jgi:hypothetical protein
VAELPELPAQDHEKGQKRLLGRFWQCKTRIGVFIFVIQFTENKELTAICVCSKLTSLRPHCQNPFSSFVENSFFKTPNGKTHCQNPPSQYLGPFCEIEFETGITPGSADLQIG